MPMRSCCSVGRYQQLCQFHTECQGTASQGSSMPGSLNETLYNVDVVQTQLDTMINNTAVCTESIPPDGLVLQNVISEVNPSHVVVVVMQEGWCRNIYGASSGTSANGAVHSRSIIRIFPTVHSRSEIYLFAVEPTLRK